ncbi:MAG: aldehyde dehydrogenase family protein, partial [Brucellaceae bacterium]|nr:aldehyde dehydrogenase family protein [Brucellaceae bacterium]
MSEVARLISPIDGSVYAERACLDLAQAQAVVSNARQAQTGWAALTIAERASYCSAALAALAAMNDELVPEIAWQMGRPVRYGGENGGVQERGQYMINIAEEALKPLVPEEKD